jgi:hypothetical protein
MRSRLHFLSRLAGRALDAAFPAVMTVLLWFLLSPLSAAVFVAGMVWLSIDRPHFVDVGRFTAGVFLVSRKNYPPSFAFGFTRYGPGDRDARSGLQVTIGRRALMVCALLPRQEWADFQRWKAERAAARPKGGAQ